MLFFPRLYEIINSDVEVNKKPALCLRHLEMSQNECAQTARVTAPTVQTRRLTEKGRGGCARRGCARRVGGGDGGEKEGESGMRSALLIPLVILSGSLETGALVRQLWEGRAGNKPADFPLHHSSAHYSAVTPTILCLLYLFFFLHVSFFFFNFACPSRLKSRGRKTKKGALRITFPHACSSVSL